MFNFFDFHRNLLSLDVDLKYVDGKFESAEFHPLKTVTTRVNGKNLKPWLFARKNDIMAVSFQEQNAILIKDLTSRYFHVYQPHVHHKDLGRKIILADLLEDESQPDKIKITYHMRDLSIKGNAR